MTSCYRTLWRWHFYAGLFCIPFVCWLACTGTIYLFKPQVEAWLDAPYAHLVQPGEARTSTAAEVRAALAAEPGSVLHAYQLPTAPDSAAQVLVGRGTDEWRLWVHPVTLHILKAVPEDDRFMQQIFHLHGELLLGDTGSILVELAASWAIVMIVTGLYLWWPRGTKGLGGVLYPRLTRSGRLFWRDLHATTGVWVSTLTLFLLISGRPWSKSWGGYLQAIRHVAGEITSSQDWTTGRSSELAQRAALSAGSVAGQQATKTDDTRAVTAIDHAGMPGMAPEREALPTALPATATDHESMPGMAPERDALPASSYDLIDNVIPTAYHANLPPPVLVAPPMTAGGAWTARSDTQNRPQRATLTLNGTTGALLTRENFDQRDWVDRLVGVGIAAHEGQLFGWPNQLLSLFTALSLLTVSVSAVVLWWRRRPDGVLGAPAPTQPPRFATGLLALLLILALLLPLLGASLLVVFLLERLVLRRLPGIRTWLGLAA